MATITVTACKRVSYGGKRIPAGQDFEAAIRDAKTLVAIGSAVYKTMPTRGAEYATRVMAAEVPAERINTLHLPEGKRRYARRNVE
jgi:hypothetical protein